MTEPMRPGEIRLAGGDLAGGDRPLGVDHDRITLVVLNTSRRSVRISSHYPFERVNARLEFDRDAARGFRLDVPAGATVGWAPGETREVELVRYGGTIGAEGRGEEAAAETAAADGDDGTPATAAEGCPAGAPVTGRPRRRIGAAEWLARYGPHDRRPCPARGHQPVGTRSRTTRSATATSRSGATGKKHPLPDDPVRRRDQQESELDVLIAGVVVIDPYLGVVKTNIGIKDGRIVGIGRAGNPDQITAGVDMTGSVPRPCRSWATA